MEENDQVSIEMQQYIEDRNNKIAGKAPKKDYVIAEGVSPEMSELIKDRNKR